MLSIQCGGKEPLDPGRGYHVLLISLDSTRRDLLSAYGGASSHAPGVPTSPRLDRLAEEGVVLEDAYSTTSWTLPSHVSMLTGQPEIVHAVDLDHQRPDDERPFLPEILRDRGYRTAGFFSGPYLEPHFGFDRGFDRYEACYGSALSTASERAAEFRRRLGQIETTEDDRRIAIAETNVRTAEEEVEELSHRDVSTKVVTDAALAEIDAAVADGRPFFLFAHYFDPHYDYLPPAPYDRLFDPDYAGPGGWDDFLRNERISLEDPTQPGKRRRVISERDLENVWARYAGELAWTDAQIGRLLDRLDEHGIAERTVVIVTADHGDEFFEHDSLGHRRTLHEEVVQVPMILRLPEVLPANRRVEGIVSTIDILPTLLELLEITPEESLEESLVSDSFLPLIRGEEEGGERSALGRIVRHRRVEMQIPMPGGRVPAGGSRIQVLETFRKGPIKITRERAWVRADDATPGAVAREVDRYYGGGRNQDLLRWIDLDAHPEEAEADHRPEFSDPRARAALRAFHDRYARLIAVRGRAREVTDADGVRSILDGLGYAEGGELSPSLEHDAFLFLPPGATLLGEDR